MTKPTVGKLIDTILKRDPNITSVAYSEQDITDEDVIKVCNALKQNPFIKSLNLTTDTFENNKLTPVSGMALASVTTLEVLKLGPRGATITTTPVIAELAKNTALHTLVLIDCPLEADAIRILAKSETLRSLSIRNCSVTKESIELLAQNTCLRSLELSCLSLDMVAAQALVANNTLKQLSIQGESNLDVLILIAASTSLEELVITQRYTKDEYKRLVASAKVKISFGNSSTEPLLLRHADQIEAKKLREQELSPLLDFRDPPNYLGLVPADVLRFAFFCLRTSEDSACFKFMKDNPLRRQHDIEEFKKGMQNFLINQELCFKQIENMDFSRLERIDLQNDTSVLGVMLFKILQRAVGINNKAKDFFIKAEIFRLLDHPIASVKAFYYYTKYPHGICDPYPAVIYNGLKELKHLPEGDLAIIKTLLCYHIDGNYVLERRATNNIFALYSIKYHQVKRAIVEADSITELAEIISGIPESNDKAHAIKIKLLSELPQTLEVCSSSELQQRSVSPTK